MRFILLAQAVAQLASNPAVQPGERLVSIDVNRESVESVVRNMSMQTGVPIAYGDALRQSKVIVTAKLSGIPLRVALSQILSGTQLRANQSTDGKGFVVERSVAQAGTSKAQGVVVGKVTDARTGKALTGANISFGNDTRGVTTGEDGAYRLNGVAVGTHIIVTRVVGYAKQTRSVIVGDGATVTVDFRLEPSANVLDQVVVTGTVVQTELKAVPNAITVITAKQIEERGITKIEQLFRGDVPGMFAQNIGSNQFFMFDEVMMFSRGTTAITASSAGTSFGTNPIKTYIDGVEMADSKYLSQIDPKSIERIEILTGPQASTIYGSNAINGVMQVFTKRGTKPRPQVTASLLSGWVQNNFSSAVTPQHDHSAQVNGMEGNISYNVGGSWNYTGPWTPSRQSSRISSFGGIRYELSTRIGRVTADGTGRRGITRNKQRGDAYQADIDLRQSGWYGTVINVGLSDITRRTLYGQTTGFNLGYRPRSWWSHELGIGRDASAAERVIYERTYRSVSDTSLFIGTSSTSRQSQRYSSIFQIPVASLIQLNITLGIDGWQNLTSFAGSSTQVLTGSLTGTPSISRLPSHNTGSFLQTQIGLMDRLYVTYGLRAEWNPHFGDDAEPNYAPRYGIAYTHDLGMLTAKLRGSYGRSTRPPAPNLKVGERVADNSPFLSSYGKIYSILPNPELAPEHQQGGEGGVELYLGNRGSLIITRYNQTVSGLIAAPMGVDSVRSLIPNPLVFGFTCTELIQLAPEYCSSQDAAGYGYVPQSQYINLGNIRNQGWELQGSINTGPVTTRGTYSWTKSRVIGVNPEYRSYFVNNPQYQPGATFKYLAEHTWALGLTYVRAATILGLNINGVGQIRSDANAFNNKYLSGHIRLAQYYRQNFSPDNRYVNLNSGYVMADVNMAQRVSSHIEGVLQVQNLMDKYQSDYLAANAVIGRQFKVGIRLR